MLNRKFPKLLIYNVLFNDYLFGVHVFTDFYSFWFAFLFAVLLSFDLALTACHPTTAETSERGAGGCPTIPAVQVFSFWKFCSWQVVFNILLLFPLTDLSWHFISTDLDWQIWIDRPKSTKKFKIVVDRSRLTVYTKLTFNKQEEIPNGKRNPRFWSNSHC